MNLLTLKKKVLDQLDKESAEHNIDPVNVRERIGRAIDIVIEANKSSNATVNNGLQDMDEYNFFISDTDGVPCFIMEIGTIYSPISIKKGGARFVKELFSLPDNINIHAESRNTSQGYEFDDSSVVIVSMTFKF